MKLAANVEIADSEELKDGDCFWLAEDQDVYFGIAISDPDGKRHAVMMKKTSSGKLDKPEIWHNFIQNVSRVVIERSAQLFASCASHRFRCTSNWGNQLGELTISKAGITLAARNRDTVIRIDIGNGRVPATNSHENVVFETWDIVIPDIRGGKASVLSMDASV